MKNPKTLIPTLLCLIPAPLLACPGPRLNLTTGDVVLFFGILGALAFGALYVVWKFFSLLCGALGGVEETRVGSPVLVGAKGTDSGGAESVGHPAVHPRDLFLTGLLFFLLLSPIFLGF